jgi:hypothetical protein
MLSQENTGLGKFRLTELRSVNSDTVTITRRGTATVVPHPRRQAREYICICHSGIAGRCDWLSRLWMRQSFGSRARVAKTRFSPAVLDAGTVSGIISAMRLAMPFAWASVELQRAGLGACCHMHGSDRRCEN